MCQATVGTPRDIIDHLLEITLLGHGTFQMKLASGEVLLFDPWLGEQGNPTYPKGYTLGRVDTVLITHEHFDHMSSAEALAPRKPKFVAIHEIATGLQSKGVENVIGMNKGGTADPGPVRVTMTHAIHSSSLMEDGRSSMAARQPDSSCDSRTERRTSISPATRTCSPTPRIVQAGVVLPADRGFVHDESA